MHKSPKIQRKKPVKEIYPGKALFRSKGVKKQNLVNNTTNFGQKRKKSTNLQKTAKKPVKETYPGKSSFRS